MITDKVMTNLLKACELKVNTEANYNFYTVLQQSPHSWAESVKSKANLQRVSSGNHD